jgi:starch synthase
VAPGRAWFIENDEYFSRDYLYGTDDADYNDNCERFSFFAQAVLCAIDVLGLKIDLIHCHDWQASLIPVYLKTLYAEAPACKGVRSLLTIHNLAYQGVFWHWDWPLTGLDWGLFTWRGLEFYGKLNFLKGGIIFADAVSTVSKSYSREILTPEHGCGLEGVLEARQKNLFGITNGLDYDTWDPATDEVLISNFSKHDVTGKATCKQALQETCDLEVSPELPLVGMVSRLTDQKGFDLLVECFEDLMASPLQLVILGAGARHTSEILAELCHVHSDRAFFLDDFDEEFARRIFAGSDLFLMPSRFEPCGLAQLIAMRYGAVPIVRATGGLADTVVDVSPEGLEDGSSTGFMFLEYNAASLLDVTLHALDTYEDRDRWLRLKENCMAQDWSFPACARSYVKVYDRISGSNGDGSQ